MPHQKQGFTLTELLVVVLIIGILSAVALPQYQKAVLKARFANMRQVAAQYKAAEEAYFMANGEYTNDINSLDISFPSCRVILGDILSCDNYFMLDPLIGSTKEPDTHNLRLVYCPAFMTADSFSTCHNNSDFYLTVWLSNSSAPDQTVCTGRTPLGISFCNSMQ